MDDGGTPVQPSTGRALKDAPPIPDHVLIRPIGAGSYGEVWLAKSALGTLRAVKIVHRRSFSSERPFEREFEGIQKYEPVSRTHESQVNILQVGRQDDYFYYVMEAADPLDTGDGADVDPEHYEPCTLKALTKITPRLPYDDCLEIGLGLTRALEHLHQSGLVHRDIKPANIIFVNGKPKLADIGLVTDADGTRTLVGTDGFLPPEGAGTAQADLYALGKVLYEISTGLDRQEYPAMSAGFDLFPERLQLLELQEIIEKACAPHPSGRYQSSAEMGHELNLLSGGQSIRRRHRWQHWCRILLRGSGWLAATTAIVIAAWAMLIRESPTEEKSLTSSHPEAVRAYELGTFHITKRTWAGFLDAVTELERAVQLDPTFAEAHASLAEVFSLQALHTESPPETYWREARQQAERALELLPDYPRALVVLGRYELNFTRNLSAAESFCRRALEQGPGESTNTWSLLSSVYASQGRFAEAITEARKSAEQDPTSALLRSQVAGKLVHASRFEEAIAEYEASIRLQPNFHVPQEELGFLLLHLGRTPEALKHLSRAWQLGGYSEEGARQRYEALGSGGVEAFWQLLFDLRSARREEGKSGDSADMARYLVKLERMDEALKWADVALSEHRNVFVLLNHPFFSKLQEHPDFATFAARVRTPSG